jgi:hypothetical protein
MDRLRDINEDWSIAMNKGASAAGPAEACLRLR